MVNTYFSIGLYTAHCKHLISFTVTMDCESPEKQEHMELFLVSTGGWRSNSANWLTPTVDLAHLKESFSCLLWP